VRITTIDIGTNTVLMVIVDLRNDGRIRTLRDEIAFPRLGRGVDESGLISPESMDRVISVLKDYRKSSDTSGSEKIIACGTSALRDARNRDEVVTAIRREASIDVEVLSGEEEAHWTFLGALSLEHESLSGSTQNHRRFSVIDIGGGSTEITLGTRDHVEKRLSLDVGCVRLTERFFQTTPPTSKERQRAKVSVRAALGGLGDIDPRRYELIGVAGTMTTLAALDQDLSRFEADKVDGYVLTLERITEIFDKVRPQTLDQLRSSPVISSGRADVLLAGILILIEFMAIYHFDRVTVSSRGLRYGLVLRELERMKGTGKRGLV
jgi:exopolyphosphatase/guanosine-5'-triphosphate,3'-diphosphate pyrophosphatase